LSPDDPYGQPLAGGVFRREGIAGRADRRQPKQRGESGGDEPADEHREEAIKDAALAGTAGSVLATALK